jgi:isoquinoline 1-oxidoreductase
MSEQILNSLSWEPERYELHEDSAGWELSRRQFFQIVGGGIAVALILNEIVEAQAPSQRKGRRGGGSVPQEIGAWLHVGEDSAVTVYTGKVEIGQNIRTSLTQVVAEELHVPLDRIALVMADTQLVPYDFGTAGSRTTPAMASQLRRVAAAAREALIDLAAEKSKVDRSSLAVVNRKITGPDG